ncbi:MAG: histone deacetylase [Bacteroidota bacterium]
MPSKTGFIYHEHFLDHDPGPGHPEQPERLQAIVEHLAASNLWDEFQHPDPHTASEEWILKVHTSSHLNLIKETSRRGGGIVDQGDTVVCAESFDVALLAAGAVLTGVDAVVSGKLQNVFCAVRPPGHHATRSEPMGFCLFNNVAVGARYAQERHGVGKIAIVDWDVHHGNGTQDIFYSDPTVLYISTHQYPYYPGSGSRSERGEGKGEGFTLNIPMRSGSGEAEYMTAFQQEIIPAIDNFHPELLFISAGFDAHRDDPLANINLTEESYKKMTKMLMESADKHCQGKIISVLEGGYNLHSLSKSVEGHVRVLGGMG